jgi:hypothetical protein
LSVRTQRATASGGYVDLELAFGAFNNPDLLVWVEVKHGAGLGESQLETYAKDITHVPAAMRRLVLLAPRDSMPTVLERTAKPIEWQRVARFLRRRPKGEVDPVHQFLVMEFLAYLEEEGLTDAPALTAAHAFSLAARPSAERTLATLLELTAQYVTVNWGTPKKYLQVPGSSKPNYGPGFWATYEVAPEGSTPESTWRSPNAWFEWALGADSARAEGRDAYSFTAGAAFENKANPAKVPGNEGWLAERIGEEFEYVQPWYWKLVRFKYPEQLLVETTVEDQAAALGEWILESFRRLAAAPPPH